MRNRENNYDLLRLISSIAIVVLHVSASYLEAVTDPGVFGELYTRGIVWSSLYNVFGRFAVPCFIMLAGAFALSVDDNCDYIKYYQSVFKKIYIPTLIFSGLYVAYSIMLTILSIIIGGKENIFQPIIDAAKGIPFSHMWYLYMMIGIYLLVPVIIRIKKTISFKWYTFVATLMMVVSSIGFLLSSNEIKWEPGFSVRFVAYFIFGDIIRTHINNERKSNKKAFMCIVGACLVLGLVTYFRVLQANAGIANEDLKLKLIDPLCPLIIIASLLIFFGFSFIKIKANLSGIASLTFYIYLVHAGIWSVMLLVIKRVGFAWNNAIVIPASILIVFMISWLVSWIIVKFLKLRKVKKNSS